MKIITLIIMLFPLRVVALTEEEIKETVIRNFQLVQEAAMKVEAARGEVTAAEGAFDHKLKFQSRNSIEDKYDNDFIESSIERTTPLYGTRLVVGHRQGLGNFPAYDGKYETSGAGEIFAGVSFPLLRDLTTDEGRTNLQVSKLEKKQSEIQLQVKKNIYVHKAISLYYKWLLANKKFAIRSDILQLAEGRSTMIEKRYQSGDLERVKVTDNERAIQKRRDELLKTEVELAELRAQLAIYVPGVNLDFPKEEDWRNNEEIPLNSPGFSPDIDLARIPQSRIVELEKEKAQILEKLYRQQRLPDLSISALGTRELGPNDPYDREALQVGVKFEYPLENRKAEGKTVSQEYKRRAIEKQWEFITTELARTYDYSLRALTLTKDRVENLRKEEKNTIRMATAEKRRWEQGSSDLFVVNLREEDVADVEIRKWSAVYEFKQHVVDAKLLSGKI